MSCPVDLCASLRHGSSLAIYPSIDTIGKAVVKQDSDVLSRIDWDRVMEIDRYIWERPDGDTHWASIRRAFSRIFRYEPNIPNERIRCKVLFVKSMVRDDYKILFERIAGQCAHDKALLDIRLSRSPSVLRLRPLAIAVRHFRTLFRLTGMDLLRSIYMTLSALHYLEVLYQLRKYYEFERLVVFADMQPIDHLLCQYARRAGVPSATMQHGLYVDYEGYPNINMVNYVNTAADWFLAWGSHTGRLIKKYNKDSRIAICGKPIESNRSDDVGERPYFSVIFDQNLFKDENRELLAIAIRVKDELDVDLNLRLHPHNKTRHYNLSESLIINRDVQRSLFVVGHTSSLIYELMRLGVMAFKYETGVPSVDRIPEIGFTNSDELLERVKEYGGSLDWHIETAKEYVKYIDQESLNHYRAFFESFVRDDLQSGHLASHLNG